MRTAEKRAAQAEYECVHEHRPHQGMCLDCAEEALKAHAAAAVLEDRALPSTIHAIVEKWLLDYQVGTIEPGDCKSILDNIVAAARREERERILNIIAGGDRPWQELASIIRALPDEQAT